VHESNDDMVENTPQDSQMLLNAAINVQSLSTQSTHYISANSLFIVVVSNSQNVIRLQCLLFFAFM